MGILHIYQLKNIKKRTAEGRAVAKNNGVKFGRKRQYSSGQETQVLQLRTEGKGYGTIANAMGMSVSKVRRIIDNNA